jgi:hypothetical protein
MQTMADVEDDVDNLDDVDDVDYPEDYVDGEELVYGSSADVLIIIPKGEAREWAELQRALYFARTWGQFKSMAPEGRYDEVRRRYHYDDWTPKTNGEEPDEDMPFDAESIKGYVDGDWPEWWQQEWEYWLPTEVRERYGRWSMSNFNGDFLDLDVEKEADIIALLERYGYKCIRDEIVTCQATGYFDFGAGRPRCSSAGPLVWPALPPGMGTHSPRRPHRWAGAGRRSAPSRRRAAAAPSRPAAGAPPSPSPLRWPRTARFCPPSYPPRGPL